ncbi:DUF6942 family protein [Shewanella sp. KX20019]|uniref:DUF6942 family protein n=1 Tax=Shewanella sp. KX20019 TaxID=2803864 RepID=UPI001F25972C|nr:hypothetical protein [Shewanella sp. KX20019]
MMIGTELAGHCFYLPNPPVLPTNWGYRDIDATQSLIELNGNHWRKILTIMAKIMVNGQDWRQYRDIQLLKHKESIGFAASSLQPNSKVHIICGQESAQGLQLNINEFISINSQCNKLLKHPQQAIYLCPYLDYRQFPNQQINQLREELGLQLLN